MSARAAILTTSMLLAGCAAGRAPAPLPELARASQALCEAERQGARADRLAAMHLALAKDQLQRGRRRLSIGDREGGRWLLLRAEADADVATLIMRESGLRDAARRTLDEASLLARPRR